MHGHVIFGQRWVHDPAGAFIKARLLHEPKAEPHDDAAA
jgi:hypothetical protein